MTAGSCKFRTSRRRVVRVADPGLKRFCGAALALVCLVGCGSKLASVSGIVRLDGKPIAAAGVAFHPVDKGPVASGTTDADGRYRLETGSQSGVAPGEYRVTVCKDRISGIGKDGLALSGGIKVEHFLPPKYNDPATSPLRVTVGQGAQSHNFDLAK